jgi:hypothetical protein
VSENRVVKRIYAPKRDEVTGEWRKLHKEELHTCSHPPNIIRHIKSKGMRWVRHAAHMGEERKVYRVLVGKPEGKRPFGRLRCRWDNGIRIDLREIGWRCLEWIQLAQDRCQWWALVNIVMNLQVLAPQS